jgi:hypothetical protein
MKRKLIYLVVFLIVLGGAIGPAYYMHKVFDSNQQNKPAESIDTNAGGHGSTAGLEQPAAETKQGGTVPVQQAAPPASASREEAAAALTPGDSAAAAAPVSGCLVGIAIVGKNGEQLYSAGEVLVKKDNKWGITALGALDASGVSYNTSPAWPDFVYAISGQANSGVSGWMYSVNGDVPMHMADRHPVKAGDKVIWWYSNSMEQPQPRWDELI